MAGPHLPLPCVLPERTAASHSAQAANGHSASDGASGCRGPKGDPPNRPKYALIPEIQISLSIGECLQIHLTKVGIKGRVLGEERTLRCPGE